MRAPVKSDPMKGRPIGSAPKPPDETATLPQLRARIAAFLAEPSGSIEVGSLAAQVMRHLDTKIAQVRLSAQTVAKQRDHHPDLADADYALIPELLSDPTVVLEEGAQHVLRTHRIISGDAGDLEK